MTIDITSCLGYVKGLVFLSVCVYGGQQRPRNTSVHKPIFMRWYLWVCCKDLYFILSFLLFCIYVAVCGCLWRSEEGVRSPGARVAGACGLHDMGAGNWSWIFCKRPRCS